ncbi:MAG: AAA family ATPase [Phycisphaerales bacterium]|nr:AAA family ATPase [Phycisphaerales bacterium]
MNKEELKKELFSWLIEQAGTLDLIIAEAGRAYYDEHKNKENFGYDLAQCQKDSYNLVKGHDLCYDRMNTAFAYSLWYHGRRVNTFLSFFAHKIVDSILNVYPDRIIQVKDLGSGTGAVSWAIGLIYHKLKELKQSIPQINIINVDSSPFMLDYSDRLWKWFVEKYPHCTNLSTAYEMDASNISNSSGKTSWLTASYLLDITDTNNSYSNFAKLDFIKKINEDNPRIILLLTSDQSQKSQLLNDITSAIANQLKYTQESVSDTALFFSGTLKETSRFKENVYKDLGNSISNFYQNAVWNDGSFYGTIMIQGVSEQELNFPNTDTTEGIGNNQNNNYYYSFTSRKDVILTKEQTEAAKHDDKPTIITGPAGCGKSIVLTERIKNLCETHQSLHHTLNILVTTFNKLLIDYLGAWIDELLDKISFKRVGNEFTFNGSTKPNITLMHFDILPTRLGNNLKQPSAWTSEDKEHIKLIEKCIQETKKENNITNNKYDNILNVNYILEEYHRVIYGLQISNKQCFLKVERKGRPKLEKDGEKRKILFDVIAKYCKELKDCGKDTFITRRQKFLKQLEKNQVTKKFTHIFVDEYQDCTEADYTIFYNLLSDSNKLVIAGDRLQAVHLGAVADVPRSEMMTKNRKRWQLEGSYRLPFRISECIKDISSLRKGVNKIIPYKGASPGARPIVVYAKDIQTLSQKIEAIYNTYSNYGIDDVTILEKNDALYKAIEQLKITCTTDTILKIKGLEKTCILWDTSTDILHKEELVEFVYTIFTRTSKILIIALSDNTLPKYHQIIKNLRKDRIILWDEDTNDNFDRFCSVDSTSTEDIEDNG